MNKFKLTVLAASVLLSSLTAPQVASARPSVPAPLALLQAQSDLYPDEPKPAVQESPGEIQRQYHAWLNQLARYEQQLVDAATSSDGKLATAGLNYSLARARAIEIEYVLARKNGASDADLRAIAARYSDVLFGIDISRRQLQQLVLKPLKDIDGPRFELIGDPKFKNLLSEDYSTFNEGYVHAVDYVQPLEDAEYYTFRLHPELDQYLHDHHLESYAMTKNQWLRTFAAIAPGYLERMARESAEPTP